MAHSDLSQDFRPADILGVRQAIKGFDKSEFFTFYLDKSKQIPEMKSGMDVFQKIKTWYLQFEFDIYQFDGFHVMARDVRN